MLEIKVDGSGKVFLTGRFDAAQVKKAEAAFLPIRDSVIVDLSGLDYISSAGIGFLMATYKRLHDAGQSMTLTNMNHRVRNVFRFAGLDRVFVIE